MKRRDLKSQADRWEVGDGPALAREIVSRLGQGIPLDDLGIAAYRERIDLRGLHLKAVGALRRAGSRENITLSGITLQGLDLSDAVLPNLRFRDSRLF
jgi:hypothetical protein